MCLSRNNTRRALPCTHAHADSLCDLSSRLPSRHTDSTFPLARQLPPAPLAKGPIHLPPPHTGHPLSHSPHSPSFQNLARGPRFLPLPRLSNHRPEASSFLSPSSTPDGFFSNPAGGAGGPYSGLGAALLTFETSGKGICSSFCLQTSWQVRSPTCCHTHTLACCFTGCQ